MVPRYPNIASSEGSQQTFRLEFIVHCAWKIFPYSKIVQNFLRLRARMFIAMQILISHSLRNVNIFVYSQMLTVWAWVSCVGRQGRKKKSYFSFNVTFFIPEIEISNSVQVFLVLISFPYYFYVQKSNGSIGSVGSRRFQRFHQFYWFWSVANLFRFQISCNNFPLPLLPLYFLYSRTARSISKISQSCQRTLTLTLEKWHFSRTFYSILFN